MNFCEYSILIFYLVVFFPSGRPMVIFSLACLVVKNILSFGRSVYIYIVYICIYTQYTYVYIYIYTIHIYIYIYIYIHNIHMYIYIYNIYIYTIYIYIHIIYIRPDALCCPEIYRDIPACCWWWWWLKIFNGCKRLTELGELNPYWRSSMTVRV